MAKQEKNALFTNLDESRFIQVIFLFFFSIKIIIGQRLMNYRAWSCFTAFPPLMWSSRHWIFYYAFVYWNNSNQMISVWHRVRGVAVCKLCCVSFLLLLLWKTNNFNRNFRDVIGFSCLHLIIYSSYNICKMKHSQWKAKKKLVRQSESLFMLSILI